MSSSNPALAEPDQRSNLSQSKTIPHGTPSGYSRHKCRCSECVESHSAYHAACRARTVESRAAKGKAYYEANREARAAQTRRNYALKAEAKRLDARERYQKNAAARSAVAVAWAKSSPEKRQAHRSKRKALARNAGVFSFTGRDWERLRNRFDNRCAYCFERKPLTQDHVVAIVRGGSHSIGNILPCCMSCNASKGAKTLTEWRHFILAKSF